MTALARVVMSGRDIEDIVRLVLAESKKLGADQAEAGASHDLGIAATARLGTVENLEYTNDRGIGVTVFFGTRKGSASTSDFSAGALSETVRKACAFARYTEPDPCAGLADAERMATDIPDLDLAHEWAIGSEEAIAIAVESEDAARSFDKRITNSEGATVSTSNGIRAYGNTHGFVASFRKSGHSISCVVVGEQNGDMQRDYHYTSARNPADLEAPKAVGERAARRTIDRLGARKVRTCKARVLLAPEIARGFFGHAIAAVSGGAQYRRSSFLLGAAGQQIFPSFLQIQERPHIARGMASAPYDAEGVATRDRELVVDGVLQGYVLGSYSARRLGLTTTGNAGGAHNLIVPGNARDMASLVRDMGSGLLVHELIGQGVNPVTGDYSRGAAGFWIEHGEVAYPVHEVTIAGNLRSLYQRIVAVGQDQDLRGGIRCGSVLIDEMAIAGT